MKLQIIETADYILAVSDEEIKENTNTFKEGFNGDWFWNSKYNTIQRIGDITSFDFKIEAYQPKGNAPELDLPLLPDIEDDVEKLADEIISCSDTVDVQLVKEVWKAGYKAATKGYSEEDLRKAYDTNHYSQEEKDKHWEDFKQSLKQPKWFVAEMKQKFQSDKTKREDVRNGIYYEPKTTTINGKSYLVGKYE